MRSIFPEIADHGIDLVDVGCSGKLDTKWDNLAGLLNVVGFDPNREECERLAALPSPYRSTRYIPSAVAGHVGETVIHLTESPSCSSVLRPRHEWLRRFSYHNLFREVGEESCACTTLDRLAETEGLRADVLKLDTQGLELPILKAASSLLQDAFCVETETGFIENYHGETVAAQVDEFMRQRGFLLFDIVVYRQGRANALSGPGSGQPLWCETLWLRDYLADQSWGIETPAPDRLLAIKALFICWCLGFADYGLELAQCFESKGLLTGDETAALSEPRAWRTCVARRSDPLALLCRLLPLRLRRALHASVGASIESPHLFKALRPTRGKTSG